MATQEEKILAMRQAMADFLDCPVEEVGNFVFGCECQTGDKARFAGGWVQIAHWYLIGMCRELEALLQQFRPAPGQQESSVPTVTLPPELMEMLAKQSRGM